MKALNILYAFLGGAVVGCAAAVLFAPEKGEDVRAKVKALVKKRGLNISDSDVDALVAELSAAVED
jgi:gas vesicle protein